MKKIAHIAIDDKFIDAAYRTFETAYPDKNVFFIVTQNKNLKYIKKAKGTPIHPVRLLSKKFINSLDQYEMVFIHWMDDLRIQLLTLASPSTKFIWLGWGGDYYDAFVYSRQEDMLLEKTALLFRKLRLQSNRLTFDQILKRTVKFFLYSQINRNEAINRVDFFSPVLKEDYDLVKKSVPNFKAQYLPWNYGTLEDDMISGLESPEITGENILIGNSATPENNHLEGFDILNKVDLNGRQIICPLSYGITTYREFIKQVGVQSFGKSFIPLAEFMPVHEYVKLISTCSCVIMNHLRQQAMGNIIIMMYLGAKIFLQKSNPAYLFFKEQGAFVFSIDEFQREGEILKKLQPSEIEINRAILRTHWSRKAIQEKTKNLVEAVYLFHRS